jgi:hypothetical protein
MMESDPEQSDPELLIVDEPFRLWMLKSRNSGQSRTIENINNNDA